MTCPKCQRDASACGCQASLLPPPPEWRRELQHRVDAYRARRRSQLGARVLEFPPEARPLRRPRAAPDTLGEALADPVPPVPATLAARAEAATGAARAEWEPLPVAAAASAVRMPSPPEEGELAEEVARLRVEPRRAEPGAGLPAAAREEHCLQLPLPMAAPTEAAAPPPAVAPRRLRLEAGVVDMGVVGLAALAFAGSAWAALGFPQPQADLLKPLLPVIVLAPGVLAAIYLLACAYAGGGTIGMQACGLCVVNFDGSRPESRAALRRRAWASLLSLTAFGLGYIWAYCDFQQLTWHDYITRTCVGERTDGGRTAAP